MIMGIIQAKEGLRFFRRARQVKKAGFRRYQGTAEEICRQVIDECYDQEKKYFRVSAGHFCEYYVRDFALCCEALLELGYAEEIESTLRYAMERFRNHGSITTAINPEGKPFDYYLPSGPESIGLFLYSINRTKNKDIADENRQFLQAQVDRVLKMMDSKTLLPTGRYSTIRDHAMRKSSCYDAVMIAVVAREAKELGLSFPYTEDLLTDRIIETYWNGTYFFQDLAKQDIVEGDANVFPFWTEIITSDEMLDQAMTAIRAAGLDLPFPLRYVSPADKKREKTRLHFANMLAPDYETDSIWVHLGLAYLQVLADQNPALARKHLAKYTALIEQHRNFLEVYDATGTPLRRALYICDESMLWCANYLALMDRLK
jgi:hypothetical protein